MTEDDANLVALSVTAVAPREHDLSAITVSADATPAARADVGPPL